jgi:hypothetical protein
VVHAISAFDFGGIALDCGEVGVGYADPASDYGDPGRKDVEVPA